MEAEEIERLRAATALFVRDCTQKARDPQTGDVDFWDVVDELYEAITDSEARFSYQTMEITKRIISHWLLDAQDDPNELRLPPEWSLRAYSRS